jgi:ubiquinone/menaquinone biosynthesis C-methylase UbiE
VKETYYRDHWTEIEPERFERYKLMFEWSDASRSLLEPAGVQTGDVVVDLGCGPGFTALELATWVGPSGHVHGIDVNADFVEFGRSVAKDRGLEETVTFHHVTDRALPLSDDSIDCIVAKNVFVYVDDPLETYQECHRVLRKGGRVLAIEGDWDFTLAEPVPEDDWKALIRAASVAFRTPTIGRQLHKVARAADFAEVTVSVVCHPDTTGRYLPMVRNLCTYARQGGALEEQKIDAVLKRCEDAVNSQQLLILTPQFVVTATR